jgi:hypothetical protein
VRTTGPALHAESVGLPWLVMPLALMLCAGVWVAGCGPQPDDSPVLVIVNGKPITQSEFEFRWSELPISTQTRYRTEGGKRKFLDDLISREVLLQEARRLGLDQTPSLRERLERVKEQLTLDELMRSKVKAQVEVPKEELDSFYASHAAEFMVGDQAARDRLRQELYAEKRRAHFEQYLSKLRASATIRMADASRFISEGTGRSSADGAP